MSIPRWKTTLAGNIDANPASAGVYAAECVMCPNEVAAFQLATVQSPATPRVRSHIFRRFVQPSPVLQLLITTTDIRTPKADQIFKNSSIEAVFWCEKPGEQYRLLGHATIFPGSSIVGPALHNSKVDWEAERKDVFNSISGHLRASFARPIPGTPLGNYDEAKKWPVRLPPLDEGNSETEVAYKNFALLIIEPTQVDFVEFGGYEGREYDRRTVFTRDGENKWDEQIVVP